VNGPRRILLPSVQSLFLDLRFDGQSLATATGIVIECARGPALVTNRHNVTGRHPETDKVISDTGGIPNEVVIHHNANVGLGRWVERTEPLILEGRSLWFEHPLYGSGADVVALPLTNLADVKCYPYSPQIQSSEILVMPADSVSVVGFPFGLRSGGSMAIWATGFVATEPEVDYQDKPIFLVDCRARKGQSGSAVIAHRNGGMVAMTNGDSAAFDVPTTRFLGVYSGRINEESDLGIVWKASMVRELISAIPPSPPKLVLSTLDSSFTFSRGF
jgi:Trypsin-like peptidase domain